MRELEESWGRRKRIRNERSIGWAVLIVALLLVGGEISGLMGYW